ncbi:MAG: sugar ABC transporter permease [Caldilineaceae bacterium]|nr:sugar ABC transporter permease [Caldilineaceae bacterium]
MNQRLIFSGWRIKQKRQLWGYLFVMPAVLFFAVFMLYPMINGIYLSLTTFTLLKPPTFIGLENFVDIFFRDRLFRQSVGVTISFVLGTTIPVWVLSLLIALLFYQRFPGREVLKSLFFMPLLPSLTVVSIVWLVLLNPSGLLTNLLFPLTGTRQIRWLSSIDLTPLMVIVVNNWTTIPFYMIIWLAGLSSIPPVFREAAMVDGASRLVSFWRVELPLLRPTAVLVAAVSTITAFQSFNIQYVLTPNHGGPVDSTTTLGILIWKYGFQFYRMGTAAAVSVVLFVVILLITMLQIKLGRSEEYTI